MKMKLKWVETSKHDPTRSDLSGRFRIEWAGRKPHPLGCYLLYDSHTKTHYHGFINYGRAQSLAQAIVDNNIFKVGLVACCGEKLTKPALAFELYQSDLFKKASRYCQLNYHRWFILSAELGLVFPDQIVHPYDRKLTAADGPSWAPKVTERLVYDPETYGRTLYYAHAGKLYTDPLLADVPMAFPMKSLGIGEQLAWYKERLDGDHERSV